MFTLTRSRLASAWLVVAYVAAGNAGFAAPDPVVTRIDPVLPQGYTIPFIDLADETLRQYVVERTPGQYLGHPTTVLLRDGRTLFCTYPLGHGGPAAVLKKSTDGGRTWSKRLPVPDNWATATNCPSIHRLTDPQGVARLIVMEGNGAMRQSVSLDDGKTWTPFEPNGLHCTVAPNTIIPISGGRHLAHYAREYDGGLDIRIYQSITEDGGLTWSPDRLIVVAEGAAPDEPGSFVSPDGKRIVSLMRENQRRCNSLFIYSDDEGKTWSPPKELPAALTGDRHMPRYAPDGRLVVTFRDKAHESPTAGDWVVWVGRYEDIIEGREGQYRVRLMDNHKDYDCGYAGLELLPDGTFVATTYGTWTSGQSPYVMSVRFTLEELDAKARALAAEDEDLQLVAVRRIWDVAPHNAFTDLEFFQGIWYCAFREGSGHAGRGDHGKLRIIASSDGLQWESVARLEVDGVDLRDAKLSITPTGRLLANSCEYRPEESQPERRNNQSVTYLSPDGKEWTGPFRIADHGYWLWQTTWRGDTGYALGYRWGTQDATRFYSTKDGKTYDLLLDHPRPPRDRSNEHALVFEPDGRAILLLRRDNDEDLSAGRALLGTAKAPYRDWEWKRMNIALGGPSLLRLPDGRLLACVRRYPGDTFKNWSEQWTELGWIDAERGVYTPALKLPSGGDSSYAGLVWRGDRLWMSYYSSHEGKTSIYFAQVKIGAK